MQTCTKSLAKVPNKLFLNRYTTICKHSPVTVPVGDIRTSQVPKSHRRARTSPSRTTNSHSGQQKKHSRPGHSWKTSTSPSGDSTAKNRRQRQSSTTSPSSSISERSRHFQSASSNISSTPPRQRLKHCRCYTSNPSSILCSSPTRQGQTTLPLQAFLLQALPQTTPS